MNKQEAAQRLAELKEEMNRLEEIINHPEKTKEERFLEIVQGLEIKIDKKKYPNSIFFFKGDNCFFELESSNLWCSSPNVWKIFATECSIEHSEIQSFIKEQMEQHFKMKGVTAYETKYRFDRQMEQHFKMKGVTAIMRY